MDGKFKSVAALSLLFILFSFFSPLALVNGQTSTDTANTADPGAYLTEFLARTVTAPRRDDYALYSRLKSNLGPNPARTTTKRTYQLGDKESFWVFDQERKTNDKVSATLVALTPHLYMFLNDSYKVNVDSLRRNAEAFESKIYPTDRRYFGQEPSPGVDGDPRLFILITPLKPASTLGYFSANDTLLQSINPFSNEREIFFISAPPDPQDAFLDVLSHEFQHMIEHNSLPNQDGWLNEGSSVLAEQLNGYSPGYINSFMARPETQLDSWSCGPCGGTSANYGGGFGWLAYLNDRLGFEAIRNIASNGQGLTGFNSVDWSLANAGHSDLSSDSLFQQWVVANYLNRRTADPVYSYKSVNAQINRLTPAKLPFSLPQGQLNQYASQYFDVSAGDNGFTLNFKGQSTTRLAPVNPHSGKMVWWANRGDYSDTSLTRDVDLSKVSAATFKFWLWFDTEALYDYIYVEASVDGQSWDPLSGKFTTAPNPTSSAYGPFYSGQSHAAGTDLQDQAEVQSEWVQENIDLSKYAGKKIKLRLEYVTDEVYNRNGAVFDDFEIPEIGWHDDVEGGVNGWETSGFLRVNNLLPQNYAVQVISRDGACADSKTTDLSKADNGQSCVQQVSLDAANTGQQFFPYKKAVVIVSPYATKTLTPALFSLNLKAGR